MFACFFAFFIRCLLFCFLPFFLFCLEKNFRCCCCFWLLLIRIDSKTLQTSIETTTLSLRLPAFVWIIRKTVKQLMSVFFFQWAFVLKSNIKNKKVANFIIIWTLSLYSTYSFRVHTNRVVTFCFYKQSRSTSVNTNNPVTSTWPNQDPVPLARRL